MIHVQGRGIFIFLGVMRIWDTHLFDGGVVLLKSGTPTFFITSLIEKKNPWIPMMASVAGSSSGYLIGKGEAPLNRWINPE